MTAPPPAPPPPPLPAAASPPKSTAAGGAAAASSGSGVSPWRPVIALAADRVLLWLDLPSLAWYTVDLSHCIVTADRTRPEVLELNKSRRTVRLLSKNAARWVVVLRSICEIQTDTALLETAEHMLVDRMESQHQAPFVRLLASAGSVPPEGYRRGIKLDLPHLPLPTDAALRAAVVSCLEQVPAALSGGGGGGGAPSGAAGYGPGGDSYAARAGAASATSRMLRLGSLYSGGVGGEGSGDGSDDASPRPRGRMVRGGDTLPGLTCQTWAPWRRHWQT